jgi:hypothetical protein
LVVSIVAFAAMQEAHAQSLSQVATSPNSIETPTPIGRNPNFRNPTIRYALTFARLGARVTF